MTPVPTSDDQKTNNGSYLIDLTSDDSETRWNNENIQEREYSDETKEDRGLDQKGSEEAENKLHVVILQPPKVRF